MGKALKLIRVHPFNLKGGGGYGFFFKKMFYISKFDGKISFCLCHSATLPSPPPLKCNGCSPREN